MLIQQESIQRGFIGGRDYETATRNLAKFFRQDDAARHYKQLENIGVYLEPKIISGNKESLAVFDQYPINPLQPDLTTPSIIVPVQFLQNFLPGFVNYITTKRTIDEAVGMFTSGAFEDAQIVQGLTELLGTAVPYGDTSNTTFASFNTNWEYRTNQQFKFGLQIPMLQEMRASRANIDYSSNVRNAAILALEILRNAIGFYGWNDGLSLTFGLLNDPGETAYQPVATGVSGFTEWAKKSYLEIWADILTAVSALREQSGNNIDPNTTPITLLVAADAVDQLYQINALGNQSVMQLIKATYSKMRVVSSTELNGAVAGDSVFYMYADYINDGSTDGGAVFAQYVPAKFLPLGTQKEVTRTIEAYANATAGVYCKRPYANVRFYGI